MVAPQFAGAKAHRVIVVVYSNSADRRLDGSYEGTVANGLRYGGIDVVDPSSIESAYRESARAIVMTLFNGNALKGWPFEWMQSRYHADRCALVQLHSEDTTLPNYRNAHVAYVRIVADYRCYDLANHRLLYPGSASTITGNDDFVVRATAYMLLGLGRNIASLISAS